MSEQITPLDDKLHWYKDAVIYELHIKAFRDGNNDGIGDFRACLKSWIICRTLALLLSGCFPFTLRR